MWWLWVRRVVIFGLGVGVVLDALMADKTNLWELVVGMVLVGVLPLDDVVRYLQQRAPTHDRRAEDRHETPD